MNEKTYILEISRMPKHTFICFKYQKKASKENETSMMMTCKLYLRVEARDVSFKIMLILKHISHKWQVLTNWNKTFKINTRDKWTHLWNLEISSQHSQHITRIHFVITNYLWDWQVKFYVSYNFTMTSKYFY